MSPASTQARRQTGFTLIELLAVLLIFGLMAGIALPNLGLRTKRVLEHESRKLAADIEFARQRAVMTSVPHRLSFDLETMDYWLEWYVSPARAQGEDEALEAELPLPGAGPVVEMSPPVGEEAEFFRIMGSMGDINHVDDVIFIDGIQTPDGYQDRGEISVFFDRDGTTDPTWIVLADDDGSAITLEVAPLADTVRFERGRL